MSSLRLVSEHQSGFHLRLQSLEAAARRFKLSAGTKCVSVKVDSITRRIETFEANQEMRLHRMECLMLASDFAHFQKIDAMIASSAPSSVDQCVQLGYQPEPEVSPAKSSDPELFWEPGGKDKDNEKETDHQGEGMDMQGSDDESEKKVEWPDIDDRIIAGFDSVDFFADGQDRMGECGLKNDSEVASANSSQCSAQGHVGACCLNSVVNDQHDTNGNDNDISKQEIPSNSLWERVGADSLTCEDIGSTVQVMRPEHVEPYLPIFSDDGDVMDGEVVDGQIGQITAIDPWAVVTVTFLASGEDPSIVRNFGRYKHSYLERVGSSQT